ncbi:MAG: M4 family metallopeptidase [Acidobacteria bacterium]|nr:M4 family metallopeptidase [Acidobacteriota bacterium]
MFRISRHPWLPAIVAAAAIWSAPARPASQAQPSEAVRTLRATEATPSELRQVVDDVRRMERDGAMRVASSTDDLLLPGHSHERLQQYHLGLKVVGGSIVRQTANGVVTSLLGQVYRATADTASPGLTAAAIRTRLTATGVSLLADPALAFLGLDDGSMALVYEVHVRGKALDARTVYLDATSGAERLSLPLARDQGAVGEGLGVLNDRKKVATRLVGGTYYTEDMLRPPLLWTIDLRANRPRLDEVADGGPVFQADLASDGDNVWTDPVAVDAHTYLGWTYDFVFKRIGFRGLDNRNAPMFAAINIYSPQQCVSGLPDDEFGAFCVNAFWIGPPFGPGGRGLMVFGNGIPPNFSFTGSGQTVGPLAGALDVVAHELTHGITDYTSGLEYQGESGALNEAFSDMMGVAVEAYFQPRGTGPLQADYLLGEDSFRAARAGSVSGIRSMQSPTAYGDPDHYSVRYRGSEDNGGVHVNSGIPNHVFFLAIEGGTNRVSGGTVTGVGFANRDQIEKVFFRAFTTMLPVRATFAQARAATIQSARDLYPSNAAVERAVTDAWTAVGVQ